MKTVFFDIDLHCDFCKKLIGTASVSSTNGWTIETSTEEAYKIQYGIVDNRCSNCEELHGSFKDMTISYMEQTGDDWTQAEEVVKANPSKVDFEVVLEARVAEVMQELTLDTPADTVGDIINNN